MITIYLENKEETEFIKNLKKEKQDFELQITNYSTTINLNNKRFIFTNSVMSKKAFISYPSQQRCYCSKKCHYQWSSKRRQRIPTTIL